jgi:hypothetical protein
MKDLTAVEVQRLAHILCDTLGIAPAKSDPVLYIAVDEGETVASVIGEMLREGPAATFDARRETIRALCWELRKLTQEIVAAEARL